MLNTARAATVSALVFIAGPALAEDGAKWPGAKTWSVNPVLTERFTIFGGAAYNWVDATVGSRSTSTGSGQDIDLGKLGIDGGDVSPIIGGQFRFGSKQQFKIQLSYMSNGASANDTVDERFTYEGVTYDVGAALETEFDTNLFVGLIGWAPWKTDTYELGFGVGAHVADLSVRFEGAGSVNGQDLASVPAKTDTLAPLPNFWVYGGYAFNPKLSLQVAGGWLSLDIGKYDGSIGTVVGTLDYRVREHIGIGAGFRYIDTELTVDQTDFKDKYSVDSYGPFVYMSLGF